MNPNPGKKVILYQIIFLLLLLFVLVFVQYLVFTYRLPWYDIFAIQPRWE